MQVTFDPADPKDREHVRELFALFEQNQRIAVAMTTIPELTRGDEADAWRRYGSPGAGNQRLKATAASVIVQSRIAHEDRPDVGAEPPASDPFVPAPVVAEQALARAAFGGAVAPLPPSVEPVPSTAVAETSSIAPTSAIPQPPASLPPVPPTVPAAVAPTVPAAPTTGASERDVQGLPWDSRIHSAGKTRNADGTWRQRRGTDPAVVSAVIAELKGAVAAPPAPPPVIPAQPAASAPTFATVMAMITPHLASQAVQVDELNACMSQLGLPTVVALTARPDLVPAADTAIRSLLAGKGLTA